MSNNFYHNPDTGVLCRRFDDVSPINLPVSSLVAVAATSSSMNSDLTMIDRSDKWSVLMLKALMVVDVVVREVANTNYRCTSN